MKEADGLKELGAPCYSAFSAFGNGLADREDDPACPLCYETAMKCEEAIARLLEHEAELKRLGLANLYIFGSTARGEARADSDVDLFFDYEKGKFGLYELMDVKDYATEILGRHADIMTRDSLHKALRNQIEASALRVF
jgi:uncharacterized protein